MLKENVYESNFLVLANALQVTSDVISKVAGNELSDTVGGESLKVLVLDTVGARIQSNLSRYMGDA